MSRPNAWHEVYEIVRLIPVLCSRPLTPRAVGWAMHDCPAGVPWHRVVNAAGRCSADDVAGNSPGRQRDLLEAEGVEFSAAGDIDMSQFRFLIDIDDLVELIADGEEEP